MIMATLPKDLENEKIKSKMIKRVVEKAVPIVPQWLSAELIYLRYQVTAYLVR